MAQTVGSIQVVASINTKDYESGKKQIEKGNEQLEGGASKTSKSFSAAWTGAIAGVAAALTTQFLGAIKSSIDGAVRRVDTLNNSARTFENMGIGAQDSAKAMTSLEKSIKGLPTPLDSAVAGMTALTATYGDINKGQKIFSALNNAILGFGGSSAMVENAITQLSQLPMDGPLDAATWNSLRNSGITPVLAAMAKDSGMSVSALKTAFGDGTLTVEDFTNKLLKLNTEGGGGLVSLEKIAADSTNGIQTGFANMQTAITRGMASIIQSIGSENISKALSSIGDGFSFVLKEVTGMINFIKSNSTVFGTFAVSFATTGAAIVLYTGYIKVATAFTAAYAAVSSYLTLVNSLQAQGIGVLRAAWMALNIVMRANPIGIIITLIVALVSGLVFFFSQTKEGKGIWSSFVSFLGSAIKSIVGFFTEAWKVISDIWGGITSFFTTLWEGVVAVFNSVVDFFKKWGLSILAVLFLPYSIAIGLIIKNWSTITAFFQTVWNGIKAVFTPVINFFTSVFSAAWTGIKAIWSAVVWYYTTIWNGIVAVFSVVSTFFKDVFLTAYNEIIRIFTPLALWFSGVFNDVWSRITSVFSVVGKFFKGVWETITGIFTGIGTTIGNAIGGSFRSVVNTILRFAVSFINEFINAINGAIDLINNIPGVNIGHIGKLPIPQLASGGITTGATLAMIGEGREQEAVLPLSKLDALLENGGGSGGDTYKITVNASADMIRTENDKREFATMIVDSFNQTRRAKGLQPIGQ